MLTYYIFLDSKNDNCQQFFPGDQAGFDRVSRFNLEGGTATTTKTTNKEAQITTHTKKTTKLLEY